MKRKLNEIVIDDTIYPRSKPNEYNIQRMLQAYDAGTVFPPLIVESKTLRLIDGRHRWHVYERKGVASVNVTEKTYASAADVFADAVRLNIGHGQSLDQFSIRNSIAKLIELGYQHEQISEVVRVPVENIGEIVKGFGVSDEGRSVALKGGLRHMQGQTLTPQQMEINRSYAGGKASFYAKQVADLIEGDLWPRNSPAFLEQMDRLVDLWTAQRPAKADAA